MKFVLSVITPPPPPPCLSSWLSPLGHGELTSQGNQLRPRHLADCAALGGLLRLLQGDLLQEPLRQPPVQQSHAEEEREEGRGDPDAGLLQPGQQLWAVHGLAGSGGHAGGRKSTRCLDRKPFLCGLRCNRHRVWDVPTVGGAVRRSGYTDLEGSQRRDLDVNLLLNTEDWETPIREKHSSTIIYT